MRNNLRTISLVVVSLLPVSVPLFAHHGTAVYDTSKMVTVKGTVTEYVWANPHVYVKVDAKDDSGNTMHWALEAQNPISETEVGWTKNTFKPGDEVEVEVKPAKNGRPVGSIGYTTRIIINGKQFKP
ncbi:MAG: hypothetical protein DMG32_15225 [Acidobacteria bacterium]|nr:MAG: hypothetical protein DMG32_15225 [Acidobacteriota bacterium]